MSGVQSASDVVAAPRYVRMGADAGRSARIGSCRQEIGGAARQQADGVERRRERHRAARRNQTVGRLPGGDAAAVRRNAQRAAGVRSERHRDGAARHRRRRAGRRAAGDVIEAPRVLHPPARCVEAGRLVGQLGHLGETDADRAGGVEPVQEIAVPDDAEIARAGEPAARPVRRTSAACPWRRRAGRPTLPPAAARAGSIATKAFRTPYRAPRHVRVRTPASVGAPPHRARSNPGMRCMANASSAKVNEAAYERARSRQGRALVTRNGAVYASAIP